MKYDVNFVLLLLLAFSVKHCIGDFILQPAYMVVGKGKRGWEFVVPLSLHCLVQAVLTLIVVLLFLNPIWWWLAPLDFIIHFIIDRLKSGPRYAGRFKDRKHTGRTP